MEKFKFSGQLEHVSESKHGQLSPSTFLAEQTIGKLGWSLSTSNISGQSSAPLPVSCDFIASPFPSNKRVDNMLAFIHRSTSRRWISLYEANLPLMIDDRWSLGRIIPPNFNTGNTDRLDNDNTAATTTAPQAQRRQRVCFLFFLFLHSRLSTVNFNSYEWLPPVSCVHHLPPPPTAAAKKVVLYKYIVTQDDTLHSNWQPIRSTNLKWTWSSCHSFPTVKNRIFASGSLATVETTNSEESIAQSRYGLEA